MREIKFRAWDGKKMSEPFSLSGARFVHPDSQVMQYTGLKDKNGVEIYEGDVVTTNYPSVRLVADNWLVEYGHTGMYQMARGSFKESIHDLVYNGWKLKVVGNIYENPELLK